jgi:hypothetical protein
MAEDGKVSQTPIALPSKQHLIMPSQNNQKSKVMLAVSL